VPPCYACAARALDRWPPGCIFSACAHDSVSALAQVAGGARLAALLHPQLFHHRGVLGLHGALLAHGFALDAAAQPRLMNCLLGCRSDGGACGAAFWHALLFTFACSLTCLMAASIYLPVLA